ncbi:response regulator [Sphingomonas sp.]|uniref:response regulator n=1 Tax=Sphingomonas sp. TaxID=28214 RepID=UPI0035B35DD8
MAEPSLRDCHILVVEDEYMLADELRMELEDAGAVVLGPVASVQDAEALIRASDPIHGGILDVNLDGDMVFAAADLLAERGVPFVFTTGYDQSVIPERFCGVVQCEKPINLKLVTRAIGRVIRR